MLPLCNMLEKIISYGIWGTESRAQQTNIDILKFSLNAIDLSKRLWGINSTKSVSRSVALG